MRPTVNEVWGWLRTLDDASSTNAARRRVWEKNLLRDGVLAGACREAIAAGETELLAEGWRCLAQDKVAGFVRDDVMKPPIEANRLLAGALGTLAIAHAVCAAREYDLPALARWVHESATAWGGGSGQRGLAEAVPWQKGVEPQTVLDEHFRALARLDAGWRVGAARDT